MGCNCKVNEQILFLHKKFGNKINVSWKERGKFKITEFFKTIIIFLITLITTPILIIYFIIEIILGKNKFNINSILRKILKKNRNERIQ